jgi:hypothetical protein
LVFAGSRLGGCHWGTNILRLFGRNTNFQQSATHRIFAAVFARNLEREFFMDIDEAQTYRPGKRTKTRVHAKSKKQALPLKQSRLSSELETTNVS